MCILCISNPLVDWHALDLVPMELGTTSGGATNGTPVGFNAALVNQLNSDSYWYNADGTVARTLSYGFTTSSSFATGSTEAAGWSAFSNAQKIATREIMSLWDDLIKPSIAELTGSPNTADIKFSNSTTDTGYAHAYYPGAVGNETYFDDKISGSVWLNPAYNSGTNSLVTPVSSAYGYMAIMHEIGHALGLDHGGTYNGGSPIYGNTSTGWLYAEDSRQFTIMSYFNASSTGANWAGKYAQTPMVYDIMAIQQLYGADYTTRAGNTTYGFNSNAGSSVYNFNLNTSPILTIWDGNGIDTIDLSGWSTASTLNLAAGSYSSVNGMTKNLAIAYDVDIENATGGAGNDIITGNDLGNILLGNGGADIINGAGGDDTINGGAGVDILNGGAGNDTIYFDALDNLTLLTGGTGFDTLIELGVFITFDLVSHNFERLLNIVSDSGSALWTDQTDYYDVTGLKYEHDINYDNGTRSVTQYDVHNTQTWSESTITYAANGSILSQVFVPDIVLPPPNRAPTITSNGAGATALVSIVENVTAVTTITATDVDAGTVLGYAIVGGADASKFTINATTGVLGFVSAPNFEAPADVGANNIYDVQVRVSDGALSDTQAIAVTVTDGSDIFMGTSGNDVLMGGIGRDTLVSLQGADVLDGGDGLLLSANQASVYRLYQAALEREPDIPGLTTHTNSLVSGGSIATVASSFVNSLEFQAKYGAITDTQFVTLLYANVLSRTPDTAGLNFWVDKLTHGESKAFVLSGFSESVEFKADTLYDTEVYSQNVLSRDYSGQVYRLYESTLNRAPDVGGFKNHVSALNNGMSLATDASGFLNSPEFQSQYGSLTNQQFVNLLYNNVLHRAPDATGLATWLNALNGGATKVSVVLGFSESAEFINNTSTGLRDFLMHDMAGVWSDRLDGGSGNDTLFGGMGSDTFAFNISSKGSDQVYGLECIDHIELAGFGYTNQSQTLSHITQVGTDAVFIDQGQTITFHHTTLSTLQTLDMFVFL